MRGLDLMGLVLVLAVLGACGPRTPEHRIVEAVGDSVRIPRSLVADGGVHFFTFQHEGRRVNFLVRSDKSGALQVHLDACYGCYQYKLGYLAEGGDLVCRACRLRYPIGDEVWDFIGACAPIALRSSIDGGDLVIERTKLEKAARYF